MCKAEIVICTESGYLESLSKCLVSSLRTFGGKYKDIPILSYQPRKDHKISPDTKKFFEKNEVEIVDLDLNKNYRNYPLANKPIICAHRESKSSADIMVFFDSDIFIANEPGGLFEFDGAGVIIRPSDYKTIGTDSKGDKNNLYWSRLYKLLDVKIQRFITTTVSNELILEYYNSGQISTLTKNSLFTQWLVNFTKVMEAGLKPKNPFFIEQSVFAATVAQLELEVKHFEKGYNYPLPQRHKILNPDYFVSEPEQLVSIHYHGYFRNPNYYNSISKKFFKTDKGKFINDMLLEFGVKKKFSYFSIIKFFLLNRYLLKLKRFKKRCYK